MNEEILIRFLTHSCTPNELDTINNWIMADPANAEWLFQIENIWSLKDELRFSEKQEIEEAYTRFISHIKEKETITHKPQAPLFLSWFRYAAAVLIIVFLGVNIYLLNKEDSIEMNTIEVPNGQRASVTLSDGTKVWLNAESKLTYPSRFSSEKRLVKLEGEGFFEVAHNAKSPFCVESNLLHVQVLGTKFNLKSYTDEPSMVTLTEGKVEVTSNNNKHQVILKSNEQVSYSVQTGMLFSKCTNTAAVKSWTTGEIEYTNMTLTEIARNLERQFGVNISITTPALTSEIFTCHFKEATAVEKVLELLKETRQLDYRIKGREIRLYKPLK